MEAPRSQVPDDRHRAAVSDYNLIDCGDDVVIGGAVQMSGHTVENAIAKTARVRLGDRVTSASAASSRSASTSAQARKSAHSASSRSTRN
jgi:hypothetical protein